MSRAVQFYEVMHVENSAMLFDVRVLKCQIEDSTKHHPTSKFSCKWFQLQQWNEVLKLLVDKVPELFKSDQASTNPSTPEILTGSLVKIAYCLRDTYHPTRRILIPTQYRPNQRDPQSGCLIGLKALSFCRRKVVISVCNLLANEGLQEVERLFQALSQPVSQTAEHTREISHYFKQMKVEPDLSSAKDLGQATDTILDEKSTPPERATLLKLRNEIIDSQNVKRRRLKRKAASLEQKGNTVDEIGEFSDANDIAPTKPSTTDEDTEATVKTQSVKSLTLQQIEERFWTNKEYILNIAKGKSACRRHNDYLVGGVKRRDLDFQVNLILYSEAQIQHTMTLLKGLFASKEYEMLDYLLKVLLPEFLIKVYMDTTGLTHDETEERMHPKNFVDSDFSQTSDH